MRPSKEIALTIMIAILLAGILAMVIILHGQDAGAYTGAIEYAELTTTGPSSTNGQYFQGDVLVCVWNTTGGSFTGEVKVQLYHTLGSPAGSKGVWVDTGDKFTQGGCKILTVPENGVRLRAYATLSSGSVRVRLSQEYPPTVRTIGGR